MTEKTFADFLKNPQKFRKKQEKITPPKRKKISDLKVGDVFELLDEKFKSQKFQVYTNAGRYSIVRHTETNVRHFLNSLYFIK